MKLGGIQGQKLASVKTVRIEKHDGAGRKIHAGRYRGCGKDRIQQTFAHQLFQNQLPGRQLPGMVGSNRQVFKKPALAVAKDMMALPGIGFNPFFKPGFTIRINLTTRAAQLQRPVTIRT